MKSSSHPDRRLIVPLAEWPAAADALLAESEQEGFRFVRRAREEWQTGVNRFSQPGEAFYGGFEDGRLVAIGGINRAAAAGCGRLRRFYVRRDARRQGIGAELLRAVLALAGRHYSRVVLRCDTEAADRFYRSQGFRHSAADGDATHVIDLAPANPEGRATR